MVSSLGILAMVSAFALGGIDGVNRFNCAQISSISVVSLSIRSNFINIAFFPSSGVICNPSSIVDLMLSLFTSVWFEIAVVNFATDISVFKASFILGLCDCAFANESTEIIIDTIAPINRAIELTRCLMILMVSDC